MTSNPLFIQDTDLSRAWVRAFLEAMKPGRGEILPLVVTVTGFADDQPTAIPWPARSFPNRSGILRKVEISCLNAICEYSPDLERWRSVIGTACTSSGLSPSVLKRSTSSIILSVHIKAVTIGAVRYKRRSSTPLSIIQISDNVASPACSRYPSLLLVRANSPLPVFMLSSTFLNAPMATTWDYATSGALSPTNWTFVSRR
jgi:hypothetical protein